MNIYKIIDNKSISFITLTNLGYIDYTLNCLRSLDDINFCKNLKCYCIGQKVFDNLQSKNYQCILLDNSEEFSKFQPFRQKNWSNIVQKKFHIIYENLLKFDYVCFTDGDIVYQNNNFWNYCLSNIQDNDLLIQNDTCDNNDNSSLCSGFMFIKSNEITISLFNPTNTEQYSNIEGWGDQIYINEIKNKLKFKPLPLELFPNGKYYNLNSNTLENNNNDDKKPYMIHFNWLNGDKKKKFMKKYNKWYI